MQTAFDPAELKPLWRIRDMAERGVYAMFGFYSKDAPAPRLLAYACFYTGAEAALLDYYAVVAEARGNGVGSAFLNALLAAEQDYLPLFIELEAPEMAVNHSETEQRMRRIRFYQRLGFSDTGKRVTVFDVPYHLYAIGFPDEAAAAAQIFRSIYDGMLGQPLAREKVRFMDPSTESL